MCASYVECQIGIIQSMFLSILCKSRQAPVIAETLFIYGIEQLGIHIILKVGSAIRLIVYILQK